MEIYVNSLVCLPPATDARSEKLCTLPVDILCGTAAPIVDRVRIFLTFIFRYANASYGNEEGLAVAKQIFYVQS